MVTTPAEPIVGCAVSDSWADNLCKRLVEKAGGRLVSIPPAALDEPGLIPWAACIYDLSPWDKHVLPRLHGLRAARPEMPLLFYLPPRPAAVAMISDCASIPQVRFRMQLPVEEQIRLLEHDTKWLLDSLPMHEVLRGVMGLLPQTPPLVQLFCRVVLRRLAAGMDCAVSTISSDLGLSSRTVQRHMSSAETGKPKQLIDRLTVLYVLHVSRTRKTTLAQVCRAVAIDPTDFYRLKARVLRSLPASRKNGTWRDIFCGGFFDSVRADSRDATEDSP